MGVAISTVAGRLMISGRSGVGSIDVDDRRADLERVVQLGAGVGLRRVLVEDRRCPACGSRRTSWHSRAPSSRDVGDAVAVQAEDDPPLQRRGRVVEVDDRPLGAAERLVGALDQVLAALGQHLDGDVVGDQVLLDRAGGRSRSRSGSRPGSRPRSPCSPSDTSSANIRRLRSGDIGSISAWLPSRRSTAHQRGAASIRRLGQARSGSSTANSRRYGR